MKSFFEKVSSFSGSFFEKRYPGLFDVDGRNKPFRHYLVSLSARGNFELMLRLGLPWWTYKASLACEEYLESFENKPAKVLEWGAGSSSQFFLDFNVDLISIESNPLFANYLIKKFPNPENLIVIQEDDDSEVKPSFQSGHKDHQGQSFFKYVTKIRDFPDNHFDLISIDGRARVACLREAIPKLRKGGVIVFDNATRSRYRSSLREMFSSGSWEIRKFSGLAPTSPYLTSTWLVKKMS